MGRILGLEIGAGNPRVPISWFNAEAAGWKRQGGGLALRVTWEIPPVCTMPPRSISRRHLRSWARLYNVRPDRAGKAARISLSSVSRTAVQLLQNLRRLIKPDIAAAGEARVGIPPPSMRNAQCAWKIALTDNRMDPQRDAPVARREIGPPPYPASLCDRTAQLRLRH